MKQNLTCFKCHRDTAILTYEENRIYKVSCPCGCEYDFEHSSMKCAEEYHYKMLELYGEIDRANRLQQENEQLKELLRLAVEDINSMELKTQCVNYLLCLSKAKSMKRAVLPCDDCGSWQWQHKKRMCELIGHEDNGKK